MIRLARSHTFGGGLVLGLLASGHGLYVFAAGIVAGVALVFAARALRRLSRLARRAASRFLPPGSGAKRTTSEGALAVDCQGLPPAELSEHERERERRTGLRQGEAAGIRAAARIERREQARRDAMSDALEGHWQRERGRSLERAGVLS